MAVLLLFGCGDDSAPGAGGGETETDGAGSDTDAPTTSDPTAASHSGTTGGMSTTDDGSTGGLDSTGTTGEPGSTGSDTTGEVIDSPYRVVFADVSGGTVRLYSATPDFAQVDSLTPAAVQSVELDRPRQPELHVDGRYVAFARGDALYVGDVWSLEVEQAGLVQLPLHRFEWSPAEEVLGWVSGNVLGRTDASGDNATQLVDLGTDGFAPEDIQFSWGPLGDRLAFRSRPDGAPLPTVSIVDADGSNPGLVVDPLSGGIGLYEWTADGEQVVFAANVDDDLPGNELVVGERDGFEVISHSSGDVTDYEISRDGTRALYLGASGMWSVNVDGTDGTLIEGAALDTPDTSIRINDDGTWAARAAEGALTATPTTLHAPTVFDDVGVVASSVRFEPGGARLAYLDRPVEDGPATLWRVDGNGAAEVSHALADGESVYDFLWAGDGLFYIVGTQDGAVGIFHTQAGDEPLFVPEADEPLVEWVAASQDFNLLILRTLRADETGRFCAVDISDPSTMIELGCHDWDTEGQEPWVGVATDPG